MRLNDEKIRKLKAKGFLPLLEWCRKEGISNADHARDLCRRKLIPSILIDGVFFFVPAHHKKIDLRGGKHDRGLIQGDETLCVVESIDEAPDALDIKPKKRGRTRKDEK